MENSWVPFSGDYTKQRQDIKLKDGTVYINCWPNAGYFIVLSDNNVPDIPVSDVTFVRKTIKPIGK